MRIGELSRETGASARSLRHYEEQGLIASRRSANGYREYAPETAATVRRVKALLALGLPTATIRELLPCEGESGPDGSSCAALRERLEAMRDTMSKQAATLARVSSALDGFLASNFATHV